MGTYTSDPTQPSDYFSIGLGTTITPAIGETLYAIINDSYYPDNSASYSATLAPISSSTPLPATLPLFAGGLGVFGLFYRRKKRNAAHMAVA